MKKVVKRFNVVRWNGKNLEDIAKAVPGAKLLQERAINGDLIVQHAGNNHVLRYMDTLWIDEAGKVSVNLFETNAV